MSDIVISQLVCIPRVGLRIAPSKDSIDKAIEILSKMRKSMPYETVVGGGLVDVDFLGEDFKL